MPQQNIRLVLAYEGSRYLGWQETPMGLSIERTLRQAIEQILQEPIALQGASRTDAGVHAQGQVANFFTERQNINLKKLQRSLNGLLPDDISVIDINPAPESFHPTIDAISKEYHYHLCTGHVQLPHHRTTSWHYPYHLDVASMKQASKLLVGEHDFAAFCNTKKNDKTSHTIRQVTNINICEFGKQRLKIVVSGHSFLYKMVRNIVGTLVYVGCRKIAVENIENILTRKDRTLSGITAPAHGLCLAKVVYCDVLSN